MTDQSHRRSAGRAFQTTRPVEAQRPAVEVEGMPLSQGFPVRKLFMEVLDGPERGRALTTQKGDVLLGADPQCDFVLQDPTVSRKHAEVRRRGQNFTLVDLDSTNGTFLGDMRVDSIVLTPGVTFRVGRTSVRFEVVTEKVSVLPTDQTRYGNIIGTSPALREIFSILDRVAPSELSVVIEGETGTGKELIAKAIHDNSLRAAGPFAVFDCSAFPPSLLESELFGHERGAFTGAMDRYRGVFERADGGTLFFDELGELDLEFQAKFLRVLETGQVRRVGAESAMQVNVRVVAATNRNLEEMVRKKVFRPDLFYRLAQVRFLLPPLRERLEDIVPLLEHFLEQHAGRTGRHPFLASEAMRVLQGYEWPGNIRELRNVLEKAVALSRGGVLTAEYFRGELDGFDDGFDSDPFGPRRLASSASHAGVPEPERAYADAPMVDAQGGVRPFKDVKEELISSFERQYLEMLLGRTGMNISRASRQAGIDRRHFYRLLKKHGIDPSR